MASNGFVVERHGYTTAGALAADVIEDMIDNGFVQITGTGGAFNKTTATGAYFVCLEAGPDVDPLSVDQPWRIGFDVIQTTGTSPVPEFLMVYVAGPLQLTGAGAVAERAVSTGGDVTYPDIIGAVGAQVNPTASSSSTNCVTVSPTTGVATYKPDMGNSQNNDEPTKGLVNRGKRVGPSGSSYPLSYRLVITNRGFWLGVWEDATTAETSSNFNWVLVQRPVDRNTGETLITGKAPVFCVNGAGGMFWQFVVRESDILRPGKRRSAETNSEDSEAILNSQNQVALSEDGKYIVTFPSRLNTSRYRYPHELDIIGITSADVVSQNSDVPLTVYGEADPRSYKALHATGEGNTGMRLLVLQDGGGLVGASGDA